MSKRKKKGSKQKKRATDLFPLVVADTPHVAGAASSGSAPSASGQSRANEGCATPWTVIGTLKLCARPGAATVHVASAPGIVKDVRGSESNCEQDSRGM